MRKSDTGFYARTNSKITTRDKQRTQAALVKWQKELREKAIQSLLTDPIEKRSMTSITMAIDPDKLSEARKYIDEFQEKLASHLESDEKKQVYQLTVSLFPIQVSKARSPRNDNN